MNKKQIALAVVALVVVGGYVAGQDTTEATASTSQSAGGTSWSEFKDHVATRSQKVGGILTDVGEAAVAGNLQKTLILLEDLQSVVGEEQDWLDSHEPDPCYADVHASLVDAYSDFDAAASAGLSEDFERATAKLSSGNESLTTATGQLMTTVCAP